MSGFARTDKAGAADDVVVTRDVLYGSGIVGASSRDPRRRPLTLDVYAPPAALAGAGVDASALRPAVVMAFGGAFHRGSKEVDSFGHARLSGIGEALANLIEQKTGFETRSVNLGHTQRGGVPTAYDRTLGQRYGLHAIDMVHDGKWGRIAVLKGLDITDITIKEAIATNRRLDQRFFDVISDLEAKV